MAKSQTIAKLEVQAALNSAGFASGASNVAIEANKLKNSIAREMRSAEKEIQTLKYATEDYGKTITRITQLERELQNGRYKNLASSEGGQAVIARLREQAKAYDEVAAKSKVAATGGLTEQQRLALTYQTTDLVTQIASGQNAMIALLQQGGQLKDQMGGFTNMFRILGGFITPVNVALTALVTTVGTLAIAFYKGSVESAKLRDDLILTNNYAKVTADSFQRMANVISNNVNASIGNTKDVLFELVSSGQFTSQSMDSVAQAILNVSKLTGQTAKEVAKSLIPAFDGTAASAKSLNDKYHFLSLAQYKQIEILEKQGKLQESAKITADALNASIEKQARPVSALEENWTKLKNAASAAWDAMMGSGRGKTLEDELETVNKTIAYYRGRQTGGGLASNDPTIATRIKEEEERAAAIREQIRLRNRSNEKKDETEKINDFAKNNQKRIDISFDAKKVEIQNNIEFAKRQATEIGKIELDAQEKIEILKAELDKKNAQEAGVFEKQNAEKYAQDVLKVLRDMDKAISDARTKRSIEEYNANEEERKQNQEAIAAAKVANDKLLMSLHDKITAENYSIANDKEKLELQKKSLFMSEREQQILMLDLQLQQQIADIKRTLPENSDRENLIKRLTDQNDMKKGLAATTEAFARMKEMSDSVWNNMSNALETFVRTGKLSFRDLARSIIQDLLLIQMKAQMLTLFKFLGAAISGTSTSSTVDYSLPSTGVKFGGLRASGGPTSANSAYLVGEKGPELFMSRTAGTIIPNNQLASMGGVTNVTNNYINAIDTKSFEQRLMSSPNAVWAANAYAQKSLAVGRGRA